MMMSLDKRHSSMVQSWDLDPGLYHLKSRAHNAYPVEAAPPSISSLLEGPWACGSKGWNLLAHEAAQ